jgi:TolA-binding protein
VEAFLDAASQSTGLTQQRCYYHAASLSLSQLDDPQRTIMLTSSYEAKFPGGIFAEEVDLLQARAHLEAREPEKARAVLVDYIEHYPDGTHEALAHLLLGKIFATTYGNCKSAQTHLLYVEQSEPDSTWATQARKILDFCAKKKATNH